MARREELFFAALYKYFFNFFKFSSLKCILFLYVSILKMFSKNGERCQLKNNFEGDFVALTHRERKCFNKKNNSRHADYIGVDPPSPPALPDIGHVP